LLKNRFGFGGDRFLRINVGQNWLQNARRKVRNFVKVFACQNVFFYDLKNILISGNSFLFPATLIKKNNSGST
jgi:hypothetical protein